MGVSLAGKFAAETTSLKGSIDRDESALMIAGFSAAGLILSLAACCGPSGTDLLVADAVLVALLSAACLLLISTQIPCSRDDFERVLDRLE
jgi:hypothetical protein